MFPFDILPLFVVENSIRGINGTTIVYSDVLHGRGLASPFLHPPQEF